jgi:hypothetical protein
VPVEGQWNRVNHPLPARDRRVLTIAACVVVLGVVGAVIAYVVHPPKSNAGCVVVTVASTMGGATQRYCGAAATKFCRDQSALASAAGRCRLLGYPTRRTGSGG